jgi:hypothetical protein
MQTVDKPRKPPRSARADELQRELAKSTDFRRRHIDEEKLERKTYLRHILQMGSEEDFREALEICGINQDSPEGQGFLSAFRKLRGT